MVGQSGESFVWLQYWFARQRITVTDGIRVVLHNLDLTQFLQGFMFVHTLHLYY